MSTTEQTHQQDLERLKSLRYMDDDFMTVCLADNFEGVELILQIILGKKDMKIKSVRTQEVLKNLQGRSATLDVHAVDSDNKEFDVEIQRKDAGAGAKRARHNSSLLDAHILKSGEETEDIPDSYVIFITENDVMKGNQPIYPVERYVTIGENKVLFCDGSHIIYVNGKYRGDDEIGKLMHDFSCTEPDDMNFDELARRARYFKKDEKGVKAMCKIMEDMRNEAAQKAELKSARETAERMIKDRELSLEKIAHYVPLLSMEELKEIESKVMQLA
ncbi:MAG: PD-(D/E)XK nuclease family transposase [Clostridiales bacterium]|nr:PD-(D/E)XK nuclease family transposase [Clostridiales bacterium]